MSINEFKGKFQDIARLNRFKVEGTYIWPNAVVIAATMPGMSFNTETQRDPDNLGPNPFKFPVDVIMNDLTITFLNDNTMTQKSLIDGWIDLMYDTKPNGGYGYWQEYRSDIKIMQLDRSNNPIYTVTAIDAYPILISDIPFDAQPNAGPSAFTVSFAYSDLQRQASGSSSSGASSSTSGSSGVAGEIIRGILGSI